MFLDYFNSFIKQLKIIFPDAQVTEILTKIENENDDSKKARGLYFAGLIDEENFDLFLKSKIKVFSHKTELNKQLSESLFNENLSLKSMLNNQPDDIKKIIWSYLHNLYLHSNINDNDKIKRLNEMLEDKNKDVKDKLHDIFGNDINSQTTNMIDDIVNSFEQILTNSKGNPLSGILNISQQISSKYADKINSGEIELNKLMGSITKTMPNMPTNGEMPDISNIPGMEGLGDMMKNMMGSMGPMMGSMNPNQEKKSEEKVIIDENFSTASVDVGKLEENKGGMKIGSMLKMADGLGVIPGGKKNKNNDNDGLGSLMSNLMNNNNMSNNINEDDINNLMPQFGKVMNVLQKLDGNGEADMDKLKEEMDALLENDFGINMKEKTD
jgi:hypothetical protein